MEMECLKNDLEKKLKEYRKVLLVDDDNIYRKILGDGISKDILLITPNDVNFDVYKKLYLMYEFTDNISYITDKNIYANLNNYLELGILSLEDYIEVITY